jgi:large subunit ribosomal protein L22
MAAVETQREQTVRAQARFVRSSARKARLVTDLIRGRSVPEARTILAFSDRAVARDVERVLRSAVANAESRPDLLWNGDGLLVSTAYADEGPTLKRHRARARGRVGRIMKRTCHITIELVQGSAPAAAAAPATRSGRRQQAEAASGEPALPTADAADAAPSDAEEPTTTDASPSPEPQAQDETEEKS